MTYINKTKYMERRVRCGCNPNNKHSVRNWWFIKDSAQITINKLNVGKKYIGKRIRIKIIIEEVEK